MFSDAYHVAMTKVAVHRLLISNQLHLNGLCLGDNRLAAVSQKIQTATPAA
jgi:hypothetical protein